MTSQESDLKLDDLEADLYTLKLRRRCSELIEEHDWTDRHADYWQRTLTDEAMNMLRKLMRDKPYKFMVQVTLFAAGSGFCRGMNFYWESAKDKKLEVKYDNGKVVCLIE